jgi:hypothetical protein
MDAFVHERGQAAETQRLFRERGGFCREHAWLFHRRSALALTGAPVAQMYEGLLRRDIARLERLSSELPEKTRRRRSPHTLLDRRDCPACERAQTRLTDKAAAFVTALQESKVQAAYRDSDGLCVQHLDLVGAEALARERHVAAFLIADLKRRLELLNMRLAQYERTRDYRFAETRTEADSAAWTDVVRSYVGEQLFDGDT